MIDQIDSIPVSAHWTLSIEGLGWIQFLERAEMRDDVLRDEKKNYKTWNHHHDTDLWIVGYFRGISRNSGKCFRILHGQFIPCRGHRRVSVIRSMGGFRENSDRCGMRGDGWPEASLLLQQGDQDLRLGRPAGSATACRVPRFLLLSTERWVWKGVVLISAATLI